MKIIRCIPLITLLLTGVTLANAQSGGPYEIKQSVIAGGGGASSGSTFIMKGTIGQSTAGPSSGATYNLLAGFWTQAVLAPTAATVGVGGRVLDASGMPLSNVIVTMSSSDGSVIAARTNALGYFSFEEVFSGQAYVVQLSLRGKQFVPQVINVADRMGELEFRSLD